MQRLAHATDTSSGLTCVNVYTGICIWNKSGYYKKEIVVFNMPDLGKLKIFTKIIPKVILNLDTFLKSPDLKYQKHF